MTRSPVGFTASVEDGFAVGMGVRRTESAAPPAAGPAGRGRAGALPAIAVPAGAAAGTVALLFLLWAGFLSALRPAEPLRSRLHLARGVSTSFFTAAVVLAVSWSQHRRRTRRLEEEATRGAHEAREARGLLELVVDNTPAALVVLDPAYRVVQANRMALRVHGQDLVGRRCEEVLAACAEHCRECPASVSFASGASREVARPHTDPRTGEVLAVESHPFDHPDGRRFVLLVERIITQQQKLQVRLVHQEKMAAMGLLSAGIAHDLGNPLASIEARLQLLDEAALGEESGAAIASVRQEVARLRRLLREMVDFARRRRDEATLVSVQGVVEDALRLLRHDPRMRGVKVEPVFDREAPPVSIVEDHLVQVVLNLLLNSLDAMPEGGTLRIEVAAAGRRVALRVHDTGVGMDHSVLARCFELLFTTKGEGNGTGLGLSVSRDILRAAGGDLELHSAPGRGTTAVVTLPAASPAESSSPAVRPAAAP